MLAIIKFYLNNEIIMRESEYLECKGQLLGKIGTLPFIRAIDKKYLKSVINRSKMRAYEADEIITTQGSFDKWVYVMLSGAVAVIKDDKEIAVLDMPGDTFGEMALIDGKERSATILAKCDTLCLAIDTTFLENVNKEEYLAFYAVFYQLFAEILARRLRETNDELVKVRNELDQLKNFYDA